MIITAGATKIRSNQAKIGHQPNRTGFLQFSQKTDYGLFLLIELAKHDSTEPLSLRTISEKNHMSFYFLQKIALDLRKAGLIISGRGKNGGYRLQKPANQMTLREIIEALEGPISLMHCLSHAANAPTCVREGWCGMRSGLQMINQTIVNTFAQTTLDHLIKPTWKPAV